MAHSYSTKERQTINDQIHNYRLLNNEKQSVESNIKKTGVQQINAKMDVYLLNNTIL